MEYLQATINFDGGLFAPKSHYIFSTRTRVGPQLILQSSSTLLLLDRQGETNKQATNYVPVGYVR